MARLGRQPVLRGRRSESALAWGIDARLVKGTMRAILRELAVSLIEQV
jgi:hypothetical protein